LIVYPGADYRLSGEGISHRSDFFATLSRLLQSTDDNSVAKWDFVQGARLMP
jgi:hypothetical protein